MSQHIIGLQASNVKRLSAVRIELDEDNRVVILSGANAQGKSSVLDCIMMALCGKEAIPGQPIRAGQDSAEIVLETEEMIVKRTFTAGGGGCLTVTNKDGFKAQSPQTLLDNMIERVGFDPLAFSRLDVKAQATKLLQIFKPPIDLAANAANHKTAYDARAEANREAKRIQTLLDGMRPAPEGLPTKEVDISALAREQTRLHGLKNDQNQKVYRMDSLRKSINEDEYNIAQAEKRIRDLRAAIDASKKELNELKEQEAVDYQQQIDATQLAIDNAERTNRAVRSEQSRIKGVAACEAAKSQAATHERELHRLAQERAEALRATKFPVEGLSIDEAGHVTFNGVPFDQASTAQQIMVGIAIGAAANSKLRVCLIRDGSLLDSATMKLIAEMAERLDLQVWMERVEDNSPAAIQIVDGTNLSAEQQAALSEEAKKPKQRKAAAPKPQKEGSLPQKATVAPPDEL